MKRRTLLKQVGTVGVATAAFAGTGSATTAQPLDVGELDVSSVEGEVTLEALLSDAELDALPEDVDPTRQGFVVAAETETIDPTACCVYCKDGGLCAPGCTCCKWETC